MNTPNLYRTTHSIFICYREAVLLFRIKTKVGSDMLPISMHDRITTLWEDDRVRAVGTALYQGKELVFTNE